MYYFMLIAAVIALDQFVKSVVTTYLASGVLPQGSITVIPGVFEITYVCNTGAAFSIFQGQRFFLMLTSMIVIASLLVFVFLRRRKEHAMLIFAASLIAGGGAGNLIDRIRFGAVVDFLAFWSFPVFNVADIAVCTGCGLAILHFVLLEYKSRKSAT